MAHTLGGAALAAAPGTGPPAFAGAAWNSLPPFAPRVAASTPPHAQPVVPNATITTTAPMRAPRRAARFETPAT